MDVPTGVAPARRRERRPRSRSRLIRDLAIVAAVAVLASFLVKTFIVRSFYIPSASMAKTLMIGDRILVDELTPTISGIHRGDIVVFVDSRGWLAQTPPSPRVSSPLESALTYLGLSAADSDLHLIKRVVGLPGDHVSCCTELGRLTVNGTPLKEPYLNLPRGQAVASLQRFSVVVPKDSLWVMGDNRDNSADSRAHLSGPGGGSVPVDDVVGKAFVIMWPPHRWSWLSSAPETFAGVH